MPVKFPGFRSRRDALPEKLWTRCPSCSEQLFNKPLEKTLHVCPSCGHHFRLSSAVRLGQLLDPGTFEERDPGLISQDPLGFVDQKPYPDRLAAAQLATGLARRRGLGLRADRGPARRDPGDGLRVHGRLDGRRGRREGRPGRRGRARRAGAADHRVGVGRGADAGGHAGADAARQDDGRPRAAARGARARTCPS